MNIYSYHHETGEFMGQSVADPNPLEEGQWLIPADATEVAPPAHEEGKARCFRDGAWVQEVDCRGQTWWDAGGNPVTVQDLGDPADSGLSNQEPTAPTPAPYLPIPQLVAVALLQVVDDEVNTVGVAAGVSFAMRLDTGLIWLFFSTEMPDLSYSYSYTVLPSSGRATVTDRQLSYMEITITDTEGNPVDPAELSVQVYRAT